VFQRNTRDIECLNCKTLFQDEYGSGIADETLAPYECPICGEEQNLRYAVFQQNTRDELRWIGGDGQVAGALAASPGMKQQNYVVAFSSKDYGADAMIDCSPTLRSGEFNKSWANGGAPPAVLNRSVIRRLTPIECERLQGFPDNWTQVEYRGKPMPDGPRYKMCGNSIAVPVIEWIFRRMQDVAEATL
jgi:DNA (cytosine-5)-methyltransferase 1